MNAGLPNLGADDARPRRRRRFRRRRWLGAVVGYVLVSALLTETVFRLVIRNADPLDAADGAARAASTWMLMFLVGLVSRPRGAWIPRFKWTWILAAYVGQGLIQGILAIPVVVALGHQPPHWVAPMATLATLPFIVLALRGSRHFVADGR